MKRIELLAPAGSMESLIAAAQAGCDAVYLGLTSFSARAFAGNFSHEEFQEAVRYCHRRDIKVYVTVNTLLFETELENAIKEIRFLYENDADAVLIQDLGLFHVVRKCFPDLAVHCSTQMHIHNINGAAFMKDCGAERVVLARETPLDIVREISSGGIETEVFAYGALCISYSGQCLMSESVKNRSGNRGMCAQLCRMKYDVNGSRNPDGEYVLSPRDLNVAERVGDLIEAGVSSLKIEGRMKRPEYVYLAVRTFREAIDAYYAGKAYRISDERMRELMLMFNRGFTEGHLFGASTAERMSHYRPNHRGLTIGKVESFRNGKVTVVLSDDLYQHDGLRILNEPVDTGLTAVRIEKNGLLVNEAHAGDRVVLDCASKPYPKKGQLLQKTSDSRLLEKIRTQISVAERKAQLTMTYTASPGKPFTVTCTDADGRCVKAESDTPVQTAQKAPLSHERIREALIKTGEYPYAVTEVTGVTDNAFLPVSVINDVRRRVLDEMDRVREKRHERAGEKPYTETLAPVPMPAYRLIVDDTWNGGEKAVTCIGSTSIAFKKSPAVHENEYNENCIENTVVSEAGMLGLTLKNCIAGMTLNIANSYAAAFVLGIPGIDAVILSSELNGVQLSNLLQAFRERCGFELPCFRLVYGRRTVMFIKDGFTEHPDTVHEIEDLHHLRFPVQHRNGVTEILEAEPYRSENSSCPGSYVILTTENVDQKKEIEKEAYEEVFGRV